MCKESKPGQQPLISYLPNGPYRIENIKKITNLDCQKLQIEKVAVFCRCGKSKKMPMCDSTHLKTGFQATRGRSRLPDRRVNYRGRDILIHFNPAFCSHDGSCLRMLPKVFNQGQNPWIKPDAASVDKIIEAIRHCPSGALSYSLNGNRIIDTDQEPVVKVVKFGPLEVSGGVRLVDEQLGELKPESPERFSLCRCGLSANTPYCDGSHFASDMDE